ncbi:MAG: tripartite tricarboxylate transporter substrate binding protein [Burkholderiales bacterium]
MQKNSTSLRRRELLLAVTGGAFAAALPRAVRAQDYPNRSIRIIVPSAPGGGADSNSRTMAAAMSQILGQSIVVENKPGGSGIISDMAVIQSRPDGYTVLMEIFSFAVNPALRKLPFDPVKDLAPVSQVLNMANVLVVPVSAPYQNLQEFLAYARANPGKLTYASYGNGGTAHLAGEMLARDAKIDWLHVPYKGGAPAVADLLAGQVSAYFANPISGIPFVKSGRLRALAVTSRKRLEVLPDVPTFIESGFKDFEVVEWNGMLVPAQTPPEVINRLHAAVVEALKDPEVHERLVRAGIEPVGNTPQEFAAFLQEQFNRWDVLVKSNNIRVE